MPSMGRGVAASGYRHYVRTTVLDKWITIKPAYRLTLEGGTELILSGRPPIAEQSRLEARAGQPARPA